MPRALITGAARGIGAATAQHLADAGWELVLFDRCSDDADVSYPLATADELHGLAATTGGEAVIGDVRSVADLRAAVGNEPLHAAIAAAGVLVGGEPVWKTEADAIDVQLAVNLGGVANLARAAVPALLNADTPRRGRFVAVGSATAGRATPRLATYAASKAGVVALVQSLAAELANTGVTANVVEPGTTNTALLEPSRRVYDLPDAAGLVDQQIDQRVLDASEIAAGIGWLCSEAAAGVTGAVLPIDAGFSAR
jgi:SDR family mycofactocin-dependent oxidoreductase